MRRGRIFFLLAFILILGVVAVFVVGQRLLSPSADVKNSQQPAGDTLVRIAVVTQFAAKGAILDDTIVNFIPWQKDAVAIGMYTEDRVAEILGRQVKFDLQAGTPVLESMLVNSGEQLPMGGSTWALSIPPGMVAVSIPIDRLSSVSYAPRSGDHVDVISSLLFVDLDTDFQTTTPNFTGLVIGAGPPDPETKLNAPLTVGVSSLMPQLPADAETGEKTSPDTAAPGIYGKVEIDPVLGQAVLLTPSEEQRPRLASQMLLQDAIVLQMGDFALENEKINVETGGEGDQNQENQDGEENAIKMPVVVTLIVRPQDAVTLNYLVYSGAQLTLALRGPNDTSRSAINPVTLQYLLDQYLIPVPLRLPYGLQPSIDELKAPESTVDAQPE